MNMVPKKRVARDKNLRPCLPLKPQEKRLKYYYKDILMLKKQHTNRLNYREGLSLRLEKNTY